jgi:thiol-disulfide isomerase/thioredoxin
MGQTQTRKQKILGDVKKARRQRIIISTIIITILGIGIVAGVILLSKPTQQDPHIGAPISSAMYDYLTGVSNTTLSKVGTGASQGVYPMTPITGGSPLKIGSLPEFLYVGADYCPYCAAERWSIIVALSKFGNFTPFTGLTYMESSATDIDANTPTFSFYGATYTSNYIAFVAVETSDRNQNPLQKLTSDQQATVNKYDCYNRQCGGLAFIDIANQWEMGTPTYAGSQFSPTILDGVGNWTNIGFLLNDPTTAVAQAVDGAANYLISAICSVDGGQGPNNICSNTVTQAPLGATNAPLSNSFNSFNMITAGDVRTDDSSWRSYPSLTW